MISVEPLRDKEKRDRSRLSLIVDGGFVFQLPDQIVFSFRGLFLGYDLLSSFAACLNQIHWNRL